MNRAEAGAPANGHQAIADAETVGIYARVSTYGQLKNTSLPEQQRKLRELAERKGYQIFDIYVDGGESGTTLERPEVTRMLGDARETRFSRVLMLDYDRMTRSDLVDATIRSVFRSLSIKIETPNDEYDLEDPDDNFEVALFGALAQREWMKTRKRMIDGRMAVQSRGGFTGGSIPFGWRRNPATGKIEIDPDEEPTVRRVWELAASGLYGYRKMAEILGDEGHVFRSKQVRMVDEAREFYYDTRPFTHALVLVVLRNPRYAGLETSRRDYTKRRHGNKRPSITVPSREFPAIITPEVFERVQRFLKDRRTYEEGRDRVDRNPLSGIVRCPSCNAPMYAKSGGKETMYYGCHIKECAKGLFYRFDFAHEAALRAMREIAAQQVADEELNLDDNTETIRKLQDDLDVLLHKEENLAQALLIPEKDGGLSPLLFARLNKQIQDEVARIKKQMQSLASKDKVLPRLREVLIGLSADDPDLGKYFKATFEALWFKVDRVKQRTKYLSPAKAVLIDGKPWGNEEPSKGGDFIPCTNPDRPTREELASLLRQHSYSAIGRMYGVSYNAVKKWALKYGLVEKGARRKT